METQVGTMMELGLIEASRTNCMFRGANDLTDESLQELANSIQEHGVMQAVSVRKHPELEGKFILIFGERRFRASMLAGMSHIPVVVREADDDAAFEYQVIENLQRVDVHPINEAKGYKFMMERNANLTTADLSIRFGKSETYIVQRLKLNDLVRELKKDFLDDKMLMGHAILLARLAPQDQREVRQQMIRRKGSFGTVGELDQFIEHHIMNSLSSAPFDKEDQELYKKAGACTTCEKRSGAAPLLFSDIKAKDKCFDKACFFTKCHRHLLNQTKISVETRPDVVFLVDYSEPVEDVLAILKEQSINPLSEFSDFVQHKTTGKKVKGLWISGNRAGRMATVFLKPDEKGKSKDTTQTPDSQIGKIRARMVRAKELDENKVYGKILEALHQHPSQKRDFKKKMLPSEEVMLWFIIYDRAKFQLRSEFEKVMGVKKGSPEEFYNQIKKLKPEQKAFFVRRVMMEQYGDEQPRSNHGYIMYRVAKEYRDIAIDKFEGDQKQVCDKREARAKDRIKQLQRIKS